MSGDEIFRQAMTLPPEERVAIAEKLLSSLQSPGQDAVDAAWQKEIKRRIAAYQVGEDRAEPADKVITALRQRLLGR